MRRRTFFHTVFGRAVVIGILLKQSEIGGGLFAKNAPSKNERGAKTRFEKAVSDLFFSLPSPRPVELERLDAPQLQAGDILAARWADERKNSTPGYWNHLGIVGVDAAQIIEAQELADGAILTPLDAFFKRYSEVVGARYLRSDVALRAANFAERRVVQRTIAAPLRRENGEKEAEMRFNNLRPEQNATLNTKLIQTGPRYSRLASIWPRVGENATAENCVSLVRRAYFAASGIDYRWRTPDSLFFNDKSGDFRIFGVKITSK